MSKRTSQPVNEKKDGKLPGIFYSVEPNTHLLHLSVLRQLCNQRAGTASTKTKGEVRGGGAKPWKQKGTGRARAGSIRSPLWVGGGITFGPKPRSYKFDIPQKARNLAILQAMASKSEDITILPKIPEIKDSKTKNLANYLKELKIVKRPLLIIDTTSDKNFPGLKRAANNLPYVLVKDEKFVGVHEILNAHAIVITEGSLSLLEKRLKEKLKKDKVS